MRRPLIFTAVLPIARAGIERCFDFLIRFRQLLTVRSGRPPGGIDLGLQRLD
jgi:hypothetical protein